MGHHTSSVGHGIRYRFFPISVPELPLFLGGSGTGSPRSQSRLLRPAKIGSSPASGKKIGGGGGGPQHVKSPLITSLYSQPMIYLCYISDMQDNPVQPAHLPAVHHPVYGGECGRAGHGAAAPAGHPASCSGRLSSASSSSTREPEQFLVSSRLFPNLGSRLWLRV